MSRADRILSFFPAFYRATEPTKLLHQVVRQLSQPLDEADTHLFRIQRSHRLQVAEHAEDIVRLAALLNLTDFHFEDIWVDDTQDYAQKLTLMRQRVQRIARVHLQGLGTPWAVMEATAIFLNATIVSERLGDPLIKHIDREGFSHRATVAWSHRPEQPRAQLYLHENPFRRQKVDPIDRWPGHSWTIDNQNMAGAAPIKLAIQGVGDRTVLPTLRCLETQEGLLFNGIVPDQKTLVIDQVNGATLDGKPVDDWLIYRKGDLSTFPKASSAERDRDSAQRSPPFDGDLEKLKSRSFSRKKPMPTAPIGRSTWQFQVAEGVYDETHADYSVYATPSEPIGLYDGDFNFDACVFDYPASAQAGMAWDERIPCALKVLLPSHLAQPVEKPAETQADASKPASNGISPINQVSRVGNILTRYKAAGVRVFVDIAPDVWILGTSVIRSPTATEGAGIESQTMRLQHPNAESFVPLDIRT